MSSLFREIDHRTTSMGEISLRRRWEPTLEVEVYEVRLDDDYLMSSLFTAAEVELATLGLAPVERAEIDVLVGGLGLGYTASAALDGDGVRSVHVVEALAEVIDWHRRHLVPLGAKLAGDERCHLVHGDFFATTATGEPFAEGAPQHFHAILLDVDHSPRRHLHPSHAGFYQPGGLARVADRLHPGGVFALWSDDPPDDTFIAALEPVFGAADAHIVTFRNPYTGDESSNTVYVAVLDP